MDAKDKNGITNLESVHMLTTPLCVDTRTPCLISPQVRELSSSAEENGVKVRKPYTITKQRERWTEEEHNKFLEALKLYGRAWRCIEEHIGTKTAVQIRSHAQKFFTKVARESSSSDASTLKAIEIPPPRPKRKPIHPYPRKLGNSSDREFSVLEQTQCTFSPTQSVLEQDNRSPTSVLSPFGLDIKGSLIWNSPNSCISPVASASGSNLGGMLNDQEIGCHSPTASVEKSGCLSSAPTSARTVTPDGRMMELDVGCEDVIPSNNDSALEGKSLKLFGRIVMVSDTQEPSLSNVGNLVQCGKSLPIEVIKRSIDMDPHGPIEPMQHIEQGGLVSCAARSAWNMWPIGMPSMIYCLPPVHEDVSSSGQSTTLPTPLWWPYYGPFISPQSVNPDDEPCQPCEEVSDENGMKEDIPWIGSNISFSGKPTLGKQNGGSSFNAQSREQSKDDEPMAALKLKLSENSAFRVHKTVSDKSVRGFMPYRRCVAEKEADHPAVANKEADSKRIQLCL